MMPYWFWNGRITPQETRRQMRLMMDQGVYSAVLYPWDGMEVRYLSEEYWKQVGAALDIARELGFELNLADEYDWPSGHAWDFASDAPELSRVLQGHPEFRMHRLEPAEADVTGPREWRGDAEARFAVAGRMEPSGAIAESTLQVLSDPARWQVPEGRWLITSYRLVPAAGGHNTRVDLMNRDAVKRYIDLVLEGYARRFPQHLGKTLKVALADHEGAYGVNIAYTPVLFDTFRARHGYDLRAQLPLLSRDSSDTATGRKLRSDYLDTVAHLYAENFTGQVARWFAKYGVKHATSLYEEQIYIQVGQAGDMFRHWRAGGVVEIDALLERSRMPIDFKEAVSVAHFDSKPLIVENQGLQGHSTYFSLEKARLGSNMCLLWGAHRLTPYFLYDPKKITWPPQWFYGQPVWPWFHHYAKYVQRAQWMNAQGTHIAPVLIYYPLETAFAESKTLLSTRPHRDLVWNSPMDHTQTYYSALQLELTRNGWDYHIADAHYLKSARIAGDGLEIGGERFRAVIVPPVTEMDPAAKEKLNAFRASGGRVIELNGMRPHPALMQRLNYSEYVEVPAELRADLAPVLAEVAKAQPPEFEVIEGERAHFYASHRAMPGVDWYWVVNDSDRPRKVSVRFRGHDGGAFEKWDAETGVRTLLASRGGAVQLKFGPWDAYFVVHRGGEAEMSPATSERVVSELPAQGWSFRPDANQVAVPYARKPAGDLVWLAPERLGNPDWWLAGPFPYDDHNGFYREYPPEKSFPPKDGWTWYHSPTYTVTLRDALKVPNQRAQGIYYAFAYVYSPEERDAQFVTAFADSMAVIWNGELKLRVHKHPKWLLLRDVWAERGAIRVRNGWNQVLLKIGPSLMAPTAFSFRIVDEQGATLRDLVYAKAPEGTPARAEERIALTVAVPPGTDARGPEITLPAGPIPERPVLFRSRPSTFALQSWTDSALVHYSGSATYERTFDLAATPPNSRLMLDLGSVGTAAEVWVNDRACGSRVWRPFTFDITRAARTGTNRLRVRVANSDAGWQAQGDTIYPKGSWVLKYETERDRLPTIRPNGLEGPVRILAVSAK